MVNVGKIKTLHYLIQEHKPQLYQKRNKLTHQKEKLPVTDTSVRGAFGSRLKVKWQIQFTAEIAGQTTDLTYLVIKKLSNAFILRYDFMARNAVIQTSEKILCRHIDCSAGENIEGNINEAKVLNQ